MALTLACGIHLVFIWSLCVFQQHSNGVSQLDTVIKKEVSQKLCSVIPHTPSITSVLLSLSHPSNIPIAQNHHLQLLSAPHRYTLSLPTTPRPVTRRPSYVICNISPNREPTCCNTPPWPPLLSELERNKEPGCRSTTPATSLCFLVYRFILRVEEVGAMCDRNDCYKIDFTT